MGESPHQAIFICFLLIATLPGVRYNQGSCSVCILWLSVLNTFLGTYWPPTVLPLGEACPFNSLPLFIVWMRFFFFFFNFVQILDINLLLGVQLANKVFSYSIGCLFTLSVVSLAL